MRRLVLWIWVASSLGSAGCAGATRRSLAATTARPQVWQSTSDARDATRRAVAATPPGATGGGPTTRGAAAASQTLGETFSLDAPSRPPAGSVDPRSMPPASGAPAPLWWTLPPPVLIENGPTATFGSGIGFQLPVAGSQSAGTITNRP